MLHPTDRFRVSPSVRARAFDDEIVLLDLKAGEYYSLNPSGALIWRGIENGYDLASIEREATSWPLEPVERARTVCELVGELLTRGLISRAAAAP